MEEQKIQLDKTNECRTPLSKQLLNLGKMKQEASEKTGRWSIEEHQLFVEGIRIYGKDWKMIE